MTISELTNDTAADTANIFLLGVQLTTGKVHLTTIGGDQRCGMGRATRYSLSVKPERGSIDDIQCQRCRKIAEKQLAKNA